MVLLGPHMSRRRALLIAGGFAGVGIGLLALGYGLVVSDACVDLQPSQLELVEIGKLQKRVRAHAKDSDRPMEVSGEELSFLVGDYLDYPIRVSVMDSKLLALVTLVQSPGCINVAFEGDVKVVDGVAEITVDRLALGGLGLTRFVSGETYMLHPKDVPVEGVSELLSRVELLEVNQEHVRLSVRDIQEFLR
jgi:hypothetical protein